MTRHRIYGTDTDFCAWLRQHPDLPSSGKDFGLSAHDNDMTVHRYMHPVDSIGSRDVQSLMIVEIKTRQGKPHYSQIDTLSKLNLFRGSRDRDGWHIRFFGVFVLVLSGTSPDNSDRMWWGSIPDGEVLSDASDLKFNVIDSGRLVDLLRFDIHPVNFTTQTFRRHHKTKHVVEIEQQPLGFKTERIRVHRS